jgi:nicotinamidase/pyrazinamidase
MSEGRATRNSQSPIAAGDALIVVDVQRDFLPGGALGVPAGDEVVEPLNGAIRAFERAGLPVYYSRDWHPPDHCSFEAQGGPWPPHCVAGTAGAGFAPALRLPIDAAVISKATARDRDAYSAFQGTTLAKQLETAGVRRVFVGGLATDYCVKATVLDARTLGFDVAVLSDAVRAVDVQPGDGQRALQEMQQSGATITTTHF